MITSIDIPDLLTTIYVLIDDWYQATGQSLLADKPGSKPEFSDSEMLTLMLAQDLIPYPGETQFIAFMRANYGFLFPRLIVPCLMTHFALADGTVAPRLGRALGGSEPEVLAGGH